MGPDVERRVGGGHRLPLPPLEPAGPRHVRVPAEAVRPHLDLDYRDVPRVRLAGPVDDWLRLPPFYPQAGPEWTTAHLHVPRPSPTSSY